MSGKVLLGACSFLFIFAFKTYRPEPSLSAVLKAYRHADHLFNLEHGSSGTDSLCMKELKLVLTDLRKIQGRKADSLTVQAAYKLGVLKEVYKDFMEARSSYLEALAHAHTTDDKFRMYVFAGAASYNLNDFDSATYYLGKAEEFDEKTGLPEDKARLYNTLGVLYFDNGNYLQARNYFTQASTLIEKNNPEDKLSLNSLLLNEAICYFKLESYDQALAIYRNIPADDWIADALRLNQGKTYANLHRYREAMSAYRKVDKASMPGVWNEMARVAMETGLKDSAAAWLEKYRGQATPAMHNIMDDGVNALYTADLDIYLGHPGAALKRLQESLIIFSGNFQEKDTRKNPDQFSGSFAYNWLFEVLIKKASAWELMFKSSQKAEDLKSAFNSWQAAVSLLSYIERSYASDDAKILLKKRSAEAYTRALECSLELDRIQPASGWLQHAFLISEKNKASVMSAQLRERNISGSTGMDPALISEEKNIRYNMARLNTRLEESRDESQIRKIREVKSGYETSLANLHRKMEKNNRFYHLKYSDDFPGIEELQQRLDKNTALISFCNTGTRIEIFSLTRSALHHLQLTDGDRIRQDIKTWVQQLQSSATHGKQGPGLVIRKQLFKEFVRPLLELVSGQETWVVVPDGIFFQLPFESLPGDEDGNFLLNTHVISYEFSSRFLTGIKTVMPEEALENPIIAFAPFSGRGAEIPGVGNLEKLFYSGKEIEGLPGRKLLDHAAEKSVFLQQGKRYPVIHLATHAVTDMENPSASFIAFYPDSGAKSKSLLYLDEIYSMQLDSCRMVVMSACETGKGEWVSNEGVLSFARAFLYTGCASAMNTLWKADDRSTAEIFRSFYRYLGEGYTKAKSLQLAKLDYIRSNPSDRNPAYWSHIVLTGDASPLYKKKQPWIWAALAISCGTFLLFGIRKKKGKKVDAFQEG